MQTPALSQRLRGKRALVTGASSGIGRAVAVRFAQEGASVAINYFDSIDGASDTLDMARRAGTAPEAGQPDHCIVHADVADEAAVLAMVDNVVANFGRLDILINNAGIQLETASAAHRIADVRRVLDVNLIGAVLCSQAAIRHFLSRPGGGVIVNCSSVHQIIPKPGFIGYSISKGGLANMTRTLALEYSDRGIRVNSVGPGAIVTPINKAWIDDGEARKAVESHIPMGRAGTPEEISAVFAFLASDESSYITGQTIYACGGLTLFGDFKQNWAS
jgi:glucose 1-dehydrogenase